MSAAWRALLASAIALLPAAARAQSGERDSAIYVLSAASRLEVKTGKAGLLGFAGHAHLVRATAFSGRVVYDRKSPSESRVEITVPTEGLEVLTPPDTAERRKVTQAMRTEVLHAAQYPVITFVSAGMTAIPDGFRVRGQLTLAGQTRDVTTDMRVEVGTDTLRATGSFSVKQTEFGIQPFRGGPGGTVRVADRVTFSLEVVGTRSPQP
jgi:polyisoprenoid-binding protein YceI